MVQYEDIKELSDEISEMYKTLQDNDADTAFYIMKESSLLLPSFEELSHELLKLLSNLEKTAKATQAKVSRESSSKVLSDPAVLDVWKNHADVQYKQRLVQTQIDFLKRIYFDCKLVYENVCRQNRSVIGEKLVGRA